MIMEVFTAYLTIKVLTGMKISAVIVADFRLWNLLLVVPKFVAIYVGSAAVQEGRNLWLRVKRRISE